MSRFFPDNKSENIIICVSYKGIGTRFSAIVTNVLPDLHILEQNQCFPLYTYDIKKNTKKEKKDNITGATLKEYQIFYNDKKITKEDIFYYVYGLLHHPKYREKYVDNFSKGFPHIPMAPKFWEYSKSGKDLTKLHLNYENVKNH